jgi:hypothetical protein
MLDAVKRHSYAKHFSEVELELISKDGQAWDLFRRVGRNSATLEADLKKVRDCLVGAADRVSVNQVRADEAARVRNTPPTEEQPPTEDKPKDLFVASTAMATYTKPTVDEPTAAALNKEAEFKDAVARSSAMMALAGKPALQSPRTTNPNHDADVKGARNRPLTTEDRAARKAGRDTAREASAAYVKAAGLEPVMDELKRRGEALRGIRIKDFLVDQPSAVGTVGTGGREDPLVLSGYYARSGVAVVSGPDGSDGDKTYYLASIHLNALVSPLLIQQNKPWPAFDSAEIFMLLVEHISTEGDTAQSIFVLTKEGNKLWVKVSDTDYRSLREDEGLLEKLYNRALRSIEMNYEMLNTEDVAVPTIEMKQGSLVYQFGGKEFLINSRYGVGIGQSLQVENLAESRILVNGKPKMFLKRVSPELVIVRDCAEEEKEQYMTASPRLIFDIESDTCEMVVLGGVLFRFEKESGTLMAFSPHKIQFGFEASMDEDNIQEFPNGVLFLNEGVLFVNTGQVYRGMTPEVLESGKRGVVVRWELLFTRDAS